VFRLEVSIKTVERIDKQPAIIQEILYRVPQEKLYPLQFETLFGNR
jgi:hypothetical protein